MEENKTTEITEKEVFSWLIMIQKVVKYAIQSGMAVGATAYMAKADELLLLAMSSSAIMGGLVALINIAKHKFNLKINSKYLKWLPLA